MEKKIYEKPEMRAVEIRTESFIATSGGGGSQSGTPLVPGPNGEWNGEELC